MPDDIRQHGHLSGHGLILALRAAYAVAAANILTAPLKGGTGALPTRIIQAIESGVQDRVIKDGLDPSTAFQLPLLLRLQLVC